jgi:hypothetical protein
MEILPISRLHHCQLDTLSQLVLNSTCNYSTLNWIIAHCSRCLPLAVGSHYITLAKILWKTLFPTIYSVFAVCIFIVTETSLDSCCLAKDHVIMSQHVRISQIIYQQSQLKDFLLVLLFYNCITTCFGLHGPSSGEYNILPCLLTFFIRFDYKILVFRLDYYTNMLMKSPM